MYFHAFEILKHNVALEVGAVESISLVHLPFGCWHPVPKSMVWCRTCISVFASYNTSSNENAPFSRWVKVIQTSSKLVHLGKASSIFVGGPPMFVVIFWKCCFQSSAKGTSREFSTKFGLCGGATTSQFLEDFPEKQSIESLVWLIQPPFFHHDWCLSYNFHGWITILLPYSQSLRPDKKAMARSAPKLSRGVSQNRLPSCGDKKLRCPLILIYSCSKRQWCLCM